MLLDEVLLLTLAPPLQLEIPSMGVWTEATAVHDDEEDCADDGDEIEG